MATQQELQAMVAELAAVRQELTAQSQRHAQEMDILRQENVQRLQEVRQEAAQAALGAQGMVPAIREMGQALQTALKEAVQDSRKEKDRLCLVDTKGLGKPSVYSGEAEQFLPWRHRMSSYICSVYPDLREVLEWCEESEKSISSEELNKAFGDEADAIDQVSNLAEKSSELASALQMVTQKEPFAIVINCGTNGCEAWRRLTRRYDPATASRKRTMLKTVISPQKQKLESRDTTRRHAKSTVDMPKGSFPSTCQKTVSVDMPKVYSRRHAKTWLSPSTCQKFVPVDMPKKLFPSTCQKFIPVDMPKPGCFRRHPKSLFLSTCQKKIVSVDMPQGCSRRHAKKDCLRRHAKRCSGRRA